MGGMATLVAATPSVLRDLETWLHIRLRAVVWGKSRKAFPCPDLVIAEITGT